MQVFGPPTISRAAFGSVLDTAGSPVLKERPAADYWQACATAGVDPAFMLAVFCHESRYGTDPASVCVRYGTRNWGNTRDTVLTMVGGRVDTDRGEFVAYVSWLAGLQDACARLFAPNKPYSHLASKDVQSIIAVWAPAGGGNDPQGYTAAVESLMSQWANLSTVPSKGEALNIVQSPTANKWDGRKGFKVEAVVLHTSEGLRDSVTAWFQDPNSDASAHYLVCKNGDVVQFVDEANAAWANGPYNYPNTGNPIIAKHVAAGDNGNLYTVSIEHERAHYTDPLTAAQWASSTALCAAICDRHGLAKDETHILGHYEFDSISRANCPGFNRADWVKYVGLVSGVQAETSPASGPSDNPAWFPQTGFWCDPQFWSFYNQYGSVASFGYPLEGSHKDADGVLRQVFENVMLELWPGSPAPRLGGLGQAYMAIRAKEGK